MINNSEYGGFLVSSSILSGKKISFSYREKSDIKELNGWILMSDEDHEGYLNVEGFQIVSASTIFSIQPMMLLLYNAPFGTRLLWEYKEETVIGFYDINANKEFDFERYVNS